MIDSLATLKQAMGGNQPIRFYAKRLAPNDNSKNQVYLGGGFTALNIIPHGDVYTDGSEQAGSVRDRAKADVNFFWLTEEGIYPAPKAQLILYPKYPEVRMSGFLLRCKQAPSEVMRSRHKGRVLFLGVKPDGTVIGYAVFHDHPLAKELNSLGEISENGVFLDLTFLSSGILNTKAQLLKTLCTIHLKGWIASQKLDRNGIAQPYAASNGGGYTLEAELGVSPNGHPEPDFLGWEVKQYGVNNFETFRARSPITLMTPEPDGGVYKSEGIEAFMHRYGYPDKNGKPDRLNFGGIYSCLKGFHSDTNVALRLEGFDADTGKILDMNGSINLIGRDDAIAASWSFAGIMEHWNRKHAQAVYVPSLTRKPPPEYCYGSQVQLCEETDFLLFLKAMSLGVVYYDPGIKLEQVTSSNPRAKRRSQFRLKAVNLPSLYVTSKMTTLK